MEVSANPLCLKLLASLSLSDWVLEDTVVSPELELLKTWSSGHQVENGANQRLLVIVQVDARSRLDIGTLDLEVACHCQLESVTTRDAAHLKTSWSAGSMVQRLCLCKSKVPKVLC